MSPAPPMTSTRPPRRTRSSIPTRCCRSTEARRMPRKIDSIAASEMPAASACPRARPSTWSSTSRATTSIPETAFTRPTRADRSIRRWSNSRSPRSTSAIDARSVRNSSAMRFPSCRRRGPPGAGRQDEYRPRTSHARARGRRWPALGSSSGPLPACRHFHPRSGPGLPCRCGPQPLPRTPGQVAGRRLPRHLRL